jgi:regulator of sigma E protease
MIFEQPPIWLVVIAFLAALGPLVFIHELGHYLVGRWCGVGAETFSIGFGREIAGWTDRRGTRWKVGWLPLGGYVKFTGDMEPSSMGRGLDTLPPEVRERSFHAKPVWQRFLIVLAGPAANFLLAIVIFAAFFAAFGVPRTPPVVGLVAPQSAAAAVGLQQGDRIVEMAGREIDNFLQIRRIASMRPGETISLEYVRGGARQRVEARLGEVTEVDRFGQKIRVGQLGIANPAPGFHRVSLLETLPEAARHTAETTRAMAEGLWQIVSGRRPVSELGGPMKMAQIAGQQASMGVFEFIQLVALFSINLGFINLLPVPMLDGGHLALYAVEAVRRRPLGERAQEWLFRGGLAALLTLMLFTTVNDLGSFGLWDRLGRLIG